MLLDSLGKLVKDLTLSFRQLRALVHDISHARHVSYQARHFLPILYITLIYFKLRSSLNMLDNFYTEQTLVWKLKEYIIKKFIMETYISKNLLSCTWFDFRRTLSCISLILILRRSTSLSYFSYSTSSLPHNVRCSFISF